MSRALPVVVLLLPALPVIADPVSDVRCREIAFSRSVENRDFEAFRSFIDADARFVAAAVSRGVDEIVETWSAFFSPDGPAIKWRPEVVEVLDDGTLALSRGPYHVVGNDTDGNPVEYWGTFNSVWRLNEDGVWRVVFDAGGSQALPIDDEAKALLDAEDDCE